MIRKVFFTVVLLLAGSLSSAYAWQGFVVKVLDGDSLQVKRGREIVEIRLYGIDCPEWKQEYGDNARRFTKAKTYRKMVTVDSMDVDRYGRTVALVHYSGRLVNRELVRAGLAWMYPKYCKKQPLCSELKGLEEKARDRRKGLWQAKNPVSPWEWKRQKKKEGPQPAYHRQYRYPIR